MVNSLQELINEPEITQWLWKMNRLKLYHLREETPSVFEETYGYEQITTSELLPELDIALLEHCVFISDQIEAIDAFEQGLNAW